jgi:hypothetical protein
MSVVSNRHNVNLFVAGKSQALANQRLAKIGYKKTKECPNPLASVCVSVPVVETIFTLPEHKALNPHIVAVIEKAQDGIIRKLYEAAPAAFVGSSVSDDDLTIAKCVEYLEDEETGGRMTIEKLALWFDASLAETLVEFLKVHAANQFTGDDLTKAVAGSLKGYKEMITGLSGGKTHYDAVQRKKLFTILALTSEGDETADKLGKRLEAMAVKDEKMAALVGMIDFD